MLINLKKRRLKAVDQRFLSEFREYDNHLEVLRFEDPRQGLLGFVAIHNNKLGDAVGGTRFYAYQSEEDALRDVLKLSRAMTYKCAISGIQHGGGKAVIIGDPNKIKTKQLLESYAEILNELGGKFYTGEDVGLTEADVQWMIMSSPYFIGKSGQAGDPSGYASLSVYKMLVTALELHSHKNGRSVAIKGMGKVGSALARFLVRDGFRLSIADIDESSCLNFKREFPDQVEVFSTDQIMNVPTSVYSPCAMGNDFIETNIDSLGSTIICGGANNQLSSDRGVAELLFKKGVLYVPDYLANAGGLINVADELEKDGYSKERVLHRINDLCDILKKIYKKSREENVSMAVITDQLARERLQ